jgi:hypothetical protein
MRRRRGVRGSAGNESIGLKKLDDHDRPAEAGRFAVNETLDR